MSAGSPDERPASAGEDGAAFVGSLFYRYPRATILVLATLVMMGVLAFTTLGRQEDPTLVQRYGAVTIYLPGADAERIEALVTKPIEESVMRIAEIGELSSVSRAGVAVVAVDIAEHLNKSEVDEAWNEFREKVEEAQAFLPQGATDPEFERFVVGAETMMVALSWEGGENRSSAVLNRMAKDLEDRFMALPGTEETNRFGEIDEEIQVVVDPDKLAAAGLTPPALAQLLREADVKVPAGRLRGGSSEFGVEIAGEFSGAARIRDVVLAENEHGDKLRLGDLAQVVKGEAYPPTRFGMRNGERVVLVTAIAEPNIRVDQWSERARAMVAEFQDTIGGGLRADIVFDQAEYTNERLEGLARNLIASALIVFAVLLVTMGLRSALVVGSALPLTVLAVLAMFELRGAPLHQMSVTGLVISLGLLIDNAIVVVDEYRRRRRYLADRLEAIRATLGHLIAPLSASTLTTVLAFTPIAALPGPAGEFVGMIGLSVIFAVVSSLVISMTIVPALSGWANVGGQGRAYNFIRDGFRSRWLTEGYRWTIHQSLRFPLVGIVVGLALPLFGFATVTGLTLPGMKEPVLEGLPSQFFPQTERDMFFLEIAQANTAGIADTIELSRQITDDVLAYEGVQEVFLFAAQDTPRVYYNVFNNASGNPAFASGFVRTDSAKATKAVIRQIQDDLRHRYPQARVMAQPFQQGPPTDAPIVVRFSGPDLDVLRDLGDRARVILADSPEITYAFSTMQGGAPVARFDADEAALRAAGYDLTDVALILAADIDGLPAGSVREDIESIPVRVRAVDEARGSLAQTAGRALPAAGETAGAPLSAFGDFVLEPKTAVISREDGQRSNAVHGFLTPYTLTDPTFEHFSRALAEAGLEPPPGYTMTFGGEAETSGDATSDLATLAVPLIAGMVISLVLAFNSFRYAAVIGVSGAMAIGLAMFGVWLFGYPFGFMAIIGGMGLLGVAINDTIVVLSALRADPKAVAGDLVAARETIIDASRHVVSTTLTTMGGFAPLILAGDSFWLPLATAIAGGVGGATFLALYFAPACFRLFLIKRGSASASLSPQPA